MNHSSTVSHRVPFYETDAMGIVHHSNYVRYLELARIQWLDEHDQPYRDVLEIRAWLDEVRGASLRMAYAVARSGQLVATAATEHALVDLDGRPRRIPRERRTNLARVARPSKPPGS